MIFNSHRRRFGTDYSYFNVWQHLLLEPETRVRSSMQCLTLARVLEELNLTPKAGLSGLQKQHLAIETALRLADQSMAQCRISERGLGSLFARYSGSAATVRTID